MAEQETAADKKLAISKIYVKDFSFESPQSPAVFRGGDWKPQTNLNLRSSHSPVDDNYHEVVLTLTVEAKADDKILFLVELLQDELGEAALLNQRGDGLARVREQDVRTEAAENR